MTIIDLPTGPVHDIDLVVEPRLQAVEAPERVHGLISLSTPTVYPLTGEEAAARDAEWGGFLKAEAAHSDYCLLGLVCRLRPASDGDTFEDAAVGIRLESPGQPADRQPIAWSIAPKERIYPSASTSPPQITIGATLGIAQVQVPVPIPVPNHGDATPYLVGMGERESNPEWRLHATSGRALLGDESLTVMVKIPVGQPAYAHLSLAATIKQKRFGLIPYRADLPPVLSTVDLRGTAVNGH
jgi:hypothetical protein